MLFFAIVYVVEGIGQARVGVIFQPLNNYLKVIGWTPVQVTAYLAILNFPWIIKPVFGLVLSVKRWHDRNKSGRWVLINLVPVVGWLWHLIECGFLRGTIGPNRFGQDPLRPRAIA